MTCEGWNPNDVFAKRLRHSVLSAWRERQAQRSLSTGLDPVGASVHRFPTGPSPNLS